MKTLYKLYLSFQTLSWQQKVFASFGALFFSAMIFMVTDIVTGYTQYEEVYVVEKVYRSSYTSTSTYVDANGNVQTRSDYNPERFILIVRGWDDTFSKDVTARHYGMAQENKTIRLPFRYGGITGRKYY